MAIEINGLPPSITGAGSNGGNAGGVQGNQAEGHKAASPAQASDTVSLTGAARQIQQLTQDLAQQPVVDSKRVEAVKEAMANGTYQIDANRVAGKMMSLEQAIANVA